MLTLYRRHLAYCPQKDKGRKHKSCSCPIWVQGTLRGVAIRKSLDLTSWPRANAIIHEWEAAGTFSQAEAEPVLISQAIADFKADLVTRLRPPTQKKYRVLLDQLSTHAADRQIFYLKDFDFLECSRFRNSWKDKAISATKKLERLRAFFNFAVSAGWVEKNPATEIKAPPSTETPTLPFTDDEIERLKLFSVPQLATLWDTLKYTGLRISDAMKLTPDKLDDGTILLRTMKTGVQVRVPIPPSLVERLHVLEPCTYYFWNRETSSNVDTASGNARRSLRRIGKLAKVHNPHPHRFRDYAAIHWLQSGLDSHEVAALLGNSPRIVEKHYSPWVPSRRQRLESKVRASW